MCVIAEDLWMVCVSTGWVSGSTACCYFGPHATFTIALNMGMWLIVSACVMCAADAILQ